MVKHQFGVVIKRCIITILLVLSALLVPAVLRTFFLKLAPAPRPCEMSDDDFIPDSRGLSKRLSEAIQFKTVALAPHNYDTGELKRFIDYIRAVFPLVHDTPFITYQVVSNYSLLYEIRGKNPSLLPYMLCGHFDVVPVDESQWDIPPFEGRIVDGILYGRGTVDNKCNVMGILEALEFMLERKMQPERSLFVAFGHDEEVHGFDGAQEISKILAANGVKLKYLLDEGSFILDNAINGVKSPVAFIGITEKGFLSVNLSITAPGGHSSMPPMESSIVTLSKALSKFNGNCHKNLFGKGPEIEMLESVAPYADLYHKFVFINLWLFSPIVSWIYEQDSSSSAMIRTTTAVTMVNGGIKENVVPSSAWALVNHRVHPSQSMDEVIEFDRQLINNPNVHIERVHETKAHPFSPYGETIFGYQTIKNTILQLKPGIPVVPMILVGNTDTRWYLNLTKEIYRFSAYSLDKRELNIIHGHNEKISVESYERVVNFYYHIIKNSDLEFLPETVIHNEL